MSRFTVGVDGRAASNAALEWVARQVDPGDAEVDLVGVQPTMVGILDRDDGRSGAEGQLGQFHGDASSQMGIVLILSPPPCGNPPSRPHRFSFAAARRAKGMRDDGL